MKMVFSGRVITTDDMELMKWAYSTYPRLSRYELAGTVCELIGWVTPAGTAKIPQCMAFFAKMEAEGMLELPALRPRITMKTKDELPSGCSVLSEEITDCGDITLDIARPGADMKRWRGYMNAFHSLGDKTVFGSRIHYFIRSGGCDLGCLLFSAASWALEARDRWIGWSVEERKARLFLIANNSRFLIFPNVRIKNLASRALSMAAKQICFDWINDFGYAPVLLETFVDTAFYSGISYKASNWRLLGYTKGRGRMDQHHKSNLSVKTIFVYPLRRDFAKVLKGTKPYQVAAPL